MSGSTAFWYASRATGIVALLLLTAVFVLGILVNRQGRLPGLPRFAVTSLLRSHLNRVLWRAIHLLAYVSWPVAFVHSIGASKDLRQGWLLVLTIACALLVAGAAVFRLAHAAREVPRAARV